MKDDAADARPPGELKADAIGFVDALVIGLNSTSPAYSLAAVIGPTARPARPLRPCAPPFPDPPT